MTKNGSRSLRTPESNRPTIVVADDIAWFRYELCQHLLRDCGIRTLQAAHALEAIRTIERNPQVTAIVADYRYDNGGPDGERLLETVGERWPHVKRMLLSAYTDGSSYERGAAGGYEVRDKALPMGPLSKQICEWLSS